MLVLAALVAVAYQLGDLVILDRQYQRVEQINREIATDNRTIANLNTELQLVATRAQADPNARLRSDVSRMREQLTGLRAQLVEATAGMISPRDMARFLEQLLVQDSSLTMMQLRTLDAAPLLPADADAKKDVTVRGPTLYRHAFEIAFSGGYLATLRYMQALESLPWRFVWDSVDYEVVDYPNSVVRLRLHTLSLSEDWIGV